MLLWDKTVSRRVGLRDQCNTDWVFLFTGCSRGLPRSLNQSRAYIYRLKANFDTFTSAPYAKQCVKFALLASNQALFLKH